MYVLAKILLSNYLLKYAYYFFLNLGNEKLFFLFLIFFNNLNLHAQKVYSVDYSSQADVKVFVADYESRADLIVYKVNYSSQAGTNDGNWFFVDYASQADKRML